MLAAIVAVIGVATTTRAMAFSFTGDGSADGVAAAQEDFNNGQNDGSCNDHFGGQNFNDGHEAYCAAFKIAYAGEMIALGATK